MRADLVVLGSDPLADIRATADIEAVVCRGEFLDRSALAGFLEQRRRYAQPDSLPLPDGALGQADHGSQAEESLCGSLVAEHRWARATEPNGCVRITETRSGRGADIRRETTVQLDSDQTVLRLRQSDVSEWGTLEFEITRESDGYRLSMKDLDGWQSTDYLATPPVEADPGLSVNIAFGSARGTRRCLAVRRGQLELVDLDVSAADGAGDLVTVRRPGSTSVWHRQQDPTSRTLIHVDHFGVEQRLQAWPSAAEEHLLL